MDAGHFSKHFAPSARRDACCIVNWNLAHPVFEQSIRTPDALALAADGVEQTYAEIARQASRLAAALNDRGIGRGSRVGILGSRSLIALHAVLGVAWAGASYVPLGLRWPEARLSAVLAQVELDALVVDDRGLALLTRNVVDATTLLAVPSDDAASAFASVSGRETLSLAFASATGRHPRARIDAGR